MGHVFITKTRFLHAQPRCFYRALALAFGVVLGQALAAEIPKPSAISPESRGTFRGRPTVKAVRVDQAPDIDGHLIDEPWHLAKPAGEFLQKEPKENVPHSQQTEFRVLFDDDALYIGVWCFDTESDRLVALNMERDGHMRFEDVVMITLDTFLDHRNGYQFSVNTNGARGDATISNNTSVSSEWDGAWMAKSRRHVWGWSTEISIPFKTISFDETTDTWGFNIYRNIGRSNESALWANSRASVRGYHVSECGDLTGLHGLRQGLGLDITPYATGKYRKDYDAKDSDLLGDFGFDVRYRLTPSLTALASVNTDFAETEIDRRQVNLTRYPLFFPEKRQFFLEDSGIFGFGGGESSRRRSRDSSDTLLMPFFSRRIGLSSKGQIMPIHFAGKLTGRIKDYNIGLLDAVLDGEDGLRNAFVGRVSRNLFEQSSVGFLTTIGDPDSDEMNSVTGLDFQYRNSNFLDGRTFEANLFALGSSSEDLGGLEPAWGASTKLYDRNIDLSASAMEIGDDFNPAIGFVRRRGTRRYMVEADFTTYHDNISWLRNTRHGYEAELYTDLGNDVVNTKQSFDLVSLYLKSQDYISLKMSHLTDRPADDFEISDGSIIPAGDYEWWDVRLLGYLGMNRLLFLRPMYRVGGFYDGTRQQIELETRYIPWPKLRLSVDYSLNLIDWEQFEDSTINVISGMVQYSFTPDLVLSNLIQYDDISNSMGVNSRLQWEYKPGAKMFFVVNQGYVDEMTGFVIKDFEVVAKIGALFRF
ncbi:MAG: DUF5916 domain-containing protein [Verrucomicrobiota bacterium]|jgi:hypothetical protein|nr:DUF5916 domain-containing protein [Verrucomicrobiota bacterium]MDP6250459.1 DUF5916 domain-containing protein [Verrucomicrobiota bacterium]MDP7176917.1 DUF5916 domain-containing protein [Verrucomicrobiota bacterium]MDP7293426.1 DUF5916 domain-containing protein [Verrucomicrobiota bacterium]MDP7440843.1 DUF5916 domain-containing protein [Verrucomicrobiota bacterium]